MIDLIELSANHIITSCNNNNNPLTLQHMGPGPTNRVLASLPLVRRHGWKIIPLFRDDMQWASLVPPALIPFLDQNCHYKNIAAQFSCDAALAPIRSAGIDSGIATCETVTLPLRENGGQSQHVLYVNHSQGLSNNPYPEPNQPMSRINTCFFKIHPSTVLPSTPRPS